MPSFPADVLTRFVTRLFMAAGVPEEEAETVSRSLVGSNLRGHDSHGVMRTTQYVDFVRNKEYQVGVPLEVEHESPAVVVCDAQWGFGQVQAHRLLDLVIPRARSLGLAAGAARNCGHIGRLGEYAERAAEEGLVLISMVNNCGAGQRVAPPGGIEPRLSTNPLCAAVPTGQEPIVLDFGTSVVAEGKVRVYHINKRPVPEGWLLDPEGRPTCDPSVLYQTPLGSILPVGGTQAYKGFGLSLVLDMLAGGLTGGRSSHAGPPAAKGNNFVALVLDPERFAGRDALLRESSQLAEYVRGTPRAAGVDEILLPGDPERRTMARRAVEGIPLEDAHWAKLTDLAGQLGVACPEPPAA
jgi:hydroxycarboxylate dehydrogenase B